MKKKALKITLTVLAVLAVLILIFFTYYLIVTSGVNLDKRKLVSLDSSIEIYDKDGNLLPFFEGTISPPQDSKLG